MAAYDLTQKIIQYFDRHLILPLLEFLTDREVYNETDMLKAKLKLLSTTKMIDYMQEIYENLAKKIYQSKNSSSRLTI